MDKKRIIILGCISIAVAICALLIFLTISNNDEDNRKTASSGNVEEMINEEDKRLVMDDTEEVSKETQSKEETTEKKEETTTLETTAEKETIEIVNKTMYVLSSANIRKMPDGEAEIVGKVCKGDAVAVNGKSGEWYRINYNNYDAFIHESMVSDDVVERDTTTDKSFSETEVVTDVVNTVDNNQQNNININNNSNNSASNNTYNNNTNNNQNNGNTNSMGGQIYNYNTDGYVDEVIRLVNEERSKNGLSPLSKNQQLCSATDKRAEEITTYFDHSRPDGRQCFTVLEEYGISYSACGENIAAGQMTPEDVMNSWMNSPGHRENTLSPNFTQIGVGYRSGGMYGSSWVQMFIG